MATATDAREKTDDCWRGNITLQQVIDKWKPDITSQEAMGLLHAASAIREPVPLYVDFMISLGREDQPTERDPNVRAVARRLLGRALRRFGWPALYAESLKLARFFSSHPKHVEYISEDVDFFFHFFRTSSGFLCVPDTIQQRVPDLASTHGFTDMSVALINARLYGQMIGHHLVQAIPVLFRKCRPEAPALSATIWNSLPDCFYYSPSWLDPVTKSAFIGQLRHQGKLIDRDIISMMNAWGAANVALGGIHNETVNLYVTLFRLLGMFQGIRVAYLRQAR